MAFFVTPFSKIFYHRRILLNTTISEIRKKYVGSLLGMVWAFLYPLLFLAVYALIYSYVLKVQFAGLSTAEYILVIFCGLIPYLGFNEAVTTGNLSVVGNAGLIKNTMFPIELVPVRTVLCAQTTQGAGFLILLFALLIKGKWSWTTPFIFIIWFMQILMEIGLAWILSSITVIVKDVQNIIAVVMLMLMMLSPIAYPVSMVPASLRAFMPINPIYSFIIAAQEVLINNQMPEMSLVIGMLVWGPLVFCLGFRFFIKMKGVFVDNV